MSAQIIHKQMLSLELWHDYYLGQPDPLEALPTSYDISDLMALVPTSDCLRVLKNLRWVFRTQKQGAVVFASVHETTSGDFQTNVSIDQPYRLTFWLMVRDRYFANFTNLPLSPTQNQIYYFSNLNDNQGHALFLTQPLPKYKANTEYRLGQLVVRQSKTLEALHYKASSSTTPSAKDWETLPSSQYVSDLDRLPSQSPLRTQVIPGVNPEDTFRLTLVDVNGQETFAFESTAPNNHPPGTSVSVNLNFSGQIPGRYRLTLNGTQLDEFVLVDSMSARNAFGLIEIVLNPSLVSPAFALLETNGSQTLIRPKTYVIRFKNRATRWRYRYEKPQTFEPEELNYYDLLDDKTYVTKQPLGLRLQPNELLEALIKKLCKEFKGTDEERKKQCDDLREKLLKDGKGNRLPMPGVMLIKPEIDNARRVTTIFSDIYL